MFSSSCPIIANIDNMVNNIVVHITDSEVQLMNDHVSSAEIHRALMQMAHTMAPGPDCMSALFYQKYWTTVGPTVIRVVQDFSEPVRCQMI